MKPIAVSTTINRPRGELYVLVEDLRNHEAWTDHMLVDWSGTAERVRCRSALPGPKNWVDIETIETDPPSKTVERTTGAGGKRVSYGTYRLREADPSTTEVEFEIRFESVPLSERLLLPLLRGYLTRGNRRALQRLKEQTESH
jgi:Polyketide cyclase / dehydrase and lipid transport